jgi:hypothetical protein
MVIAPCRVPTECSSQPARYSTGGLAGRIYRDPALRQQIAQLVILVAYCSCRKRADQRLVDAVELDALIDELLALIASAWIDRLSCTRMI